MKIPSNINREDLIKAADKIISEGIPPNAHSSTYDVFYKNELLPPKLIVSYANLFRNNTELDRNSFEGGLGTECFNLLESNGFEIYKKDSIYPTLKRFLEQAKTGELKVSKYPKKIKGLECAVSFGKGNQAKIPWISLLRQPHTTSNGIYPVYLFYKDHNLIILAYGISETNAPQESWNITEPKSIKSYFKENNLGIPDRYGDSFVYKVYNAKALPTPESLDKDIDELIEIYSLSKNNAAKHAIDNFNIQFFKESAKNAGLQYNPILITRFVASKATKPFVILTGLSGSGKTKLAQAFVQWICRHESQYCIVPVGADWTNREPLLGYPNGLEQDKYVTPDSGVLQLLMDAGKNRDLPFFLILDEMNLSHVERYFADFLSIMESGENIHLYSGDDRKDTNGTTIDKAISWPDNLFIIGTVNIDETTYMFSPKVLDRANVIEFRISPEEMRSFIGNSSKPDMQNLYVNRDRLQGGLGQNMAADFLKMARDKTINHNLNLNILNDFFAELQHVGAEFGYRSASEIELLITRLAGFGISGNPGIDIAVMQKLLPKLHGSRKKLVGPLETLAGLCIAPESYGTGLSLRDVYRKFTEDTSEASEKLKKIIYPISFEKIQRMLKNVIENGFTSYAEA